MNARSLDRSRTELSHFLRQHRERLSPADVGLPETGRRRTPGLRREEVAALAGVGLTWYTWFEQGRDIGVSEAFLLNISRALKLGDAECCHLFLLAHRRPPPADIYDWPSVNPRIQQIMDALDMMPAYVLSLGWDVVAWNAAAERLFGLAARERVERNFLRMVFADPEFRRHHPSFHDDGPRLIANFRCDLAIAPDNPALLALVDDLKKLSADFRRWWGQPARGEYIRGISQFLDHNIVTDFQHEMMTVDEHRYLRMIVCFPATT
ncbi:helix-turn-helix transcriptional regulator [Roseinatronobacter alkalisoli]|uniref:Helix-turn-helix transcriptional regulator n=1 Tax=Roseinatronobacter alkalisoli TaxID=3028235 RepID=A0ABT5T6U1_9RHOB|nr:helix-turn-helix transcriptional regulator [Roseinatronobacter sp. HJB301]MDD7970840.1 helix-turn-helix transcriptional regulator [Roseinatronobacter sp. HJB301]